jgi:uncharacterized membrane protein
MTGINLLVYYIVKNLTNEVRGAMFGAALYFFYPAPYLLASVLTNQHLATLLILFGLYLFMSDKGKGTNQMILSGLLVSLGNIIRPIGVISIIACILYFIILIMRKIDFHALKETSKDVLSILKKISAFLVTYLLVGFIASVTISATGLNAQGLTNNDPYWKFVIGLNQETYGGYSNKLVAIISQADSLDERYQMEKNIIAESISILKKNFPRFIYRKNYNMWALYENSSWSFGKDASQNRDAISNHRWQTLISRIVKLDKCYYLIVLLLALLGIILTIVRKKHTTKFCLCLLIFGAYFGAHIFIEVQTRYRYFAMPFVFIVATFAILLLSKKTRNYAGNNNNEHHKDSRKQQEKLANGGISEEDSNVSAKSSGVSVHGKEQSINNL